MVRLQSMEVEGRVKNPYAAQLSGGGIGSRPSTAKAPLVFALAIFALFAVSTSLLNSKEEDLGNQHPIGSSSPLSSSSAKYVVHNSPLPEQKHVSANTDYDDDDNMGPSSTNNGGGGYWTSSPYEDQADDGMREADLAVAISELVTPPVTSRPEYARYQGDTLEGAGQLIYDLKTPHGMAYDFIVSKDKRKLAVDDPNLAQRYVLALLFYATGGKDLNEWAPAPNEKARHGWNSGTAHFLSGLHECHWVKKSLEDRLWGILSIESDSDRRVGVTKCNAGMEVTELRLGTGGGVI